VFTASQKKTVVLVKTEIVGEGGEMRKLQWTKQKNISLV
jgi:hypothetical protein